MTFHKKLIPGIGLFAVLLGSSMISSCSKSIPSSEPLSALTPKSADANAGTWKMILLSSPSQIPIAAPVPVSDPTYQAELKAIKSGQKNINKSEKDVIAYWSAGGVLRWNEILRELVARADLPPSPNSDGSYPAPDPNNPFAYPTYPFSNPPYAVRAYSYVAVAQYEALKAAWYYKFLYNRPSPYMNDNGIQSLMPATGVPSYPSEDAVEAGVNATLLTLLFPTSVDEINLKAGEQQEAIQLSGRASASDVATGFALGQAVAALFVARAKTDGMKAAAGSPAEWQQLVDQTVARGEIAWKSLENPPRPPMLPLFGQVKAWMLTPADIVNVRSVPPPSTS